MYRLVFEILVIQNIIENCDKISFVKIYVIYSLLTYIITSDAVLLFKVCDFIMILISNLHMRLYV